MFLLALAYFVILVVLVVFGFNDKWTRYSHFAYLVLFAILGFAVFWSVLNK